MRHVRNGVVYDTEKAEEIFFWCNCPYPTDGRYLEETLFRTPKGRWFKTYTGGGLSSVAVSCGNEISGSSGFSPLSEDEAIEWLQEHGSDAKAVAALEKYFSERLEEA